MGSGKTTVGKVLSQVLSYSFCDRFDPYFLVNSMENFFGANWVHDKNNTTYMNKFQDISMTSL